MGRNAQSAAEAVAARRSTIFGWIGRWAMGLGLGWGDDDREMDVVEGQCNGGKTYFRFLRAEALQTILRYISLLKVCMKLCAVSLWFVAITRLRF